MKFITVRELRSQSSDVWQSLRKDKELLITLNGKPIAILSEVSPDSWEETVSAIRTARAVMAVENMQTESMLVGNNLLTESEIDAEIKAVRKQRKK